MGEILYNKLVRDHIPQIIENSQRVPVVRTADISELKRRLCEKLIEELDEFKETPTIEEFADMLEVTDGIALAFNLNLECVKQIQAQKREERGGFQKGLILEKVIE